MNNELDVYFPRMQCDGEDCIIIPLNQIVSINVDITPSSDFYPGAEMTIVVRGKKQ